MNNYAKWVETIESTTDLNGGGHILAPIFEGALSKKKFNTVFEWCAGPAWIGMWLLEQKICKNLITGDINEKSIDFVKKSAKKHNYNVKTYVSDNMKSIPKRKKFDLVVSNPPNYCNIQKSHPFGFLRNDIRPSDIDWKIHKDFYENISDYLHKESVMYISEVDIYNENVYFDGALYDKRPEQPIITFEKMTKDNNLKINNIIPYFVEGMKCYLLEISKI
mgnify:FL=1